MGLFGFGKKKDASEQAGEAAAAGGDKGGDNGKAVATGGGGFKPDPRKAKAWFDRAHTVADSANYDYAVDCFINAFRFDPSNMAEHEKLYDSALKRMVSGGKPAGFKDSMSSGGKAVVEKFAHAEKLWAMDPRNPTRAIGVMQKAVELHESEEELSMREVAMWMGVKAMELCGGKAATKPNFVKLMELFEKVEAYKEAEECCRRAISVGGDDGNLVSKLKDMAALRTMVQSNLTGKAGGFKEGVKGGMDEQRNRELDEMSGGTDEAIDRMVKNAKDAHEAKPDDLDLMLKYVRALTRKESDDDDEQAITILRSYFTKTSQYRFKTEASDLVMKQFHRHHRMLRDALKDNPTDEATRKEIESLKKRQLEFELKEFEERVKNYPTVMKLRFELGRRLLVAKRYDEAVGAFQDAQADPKIRVMCMEALGICYVQMDWLDAAIDTLKKGVEQHPLSDDDMGKSLRYLLVDALEQRAKKFSAVDDAKEALTIASQLLQMDIRYRDIRERVGRLRDLIVELQKAPTNPTSGG